jgi:hypothetical protein
MGPFAIRTPFLTGLSSWSPFLYDSFRVVEPFLSVLFLSLTSFLVESVYIKEQFLYVSFHIIYDNALSFLIVALCFAELCDKISPK